MWGRLPQGISCLICQALQVWNVRKHERHGTLRKNVKPFEAWSSWRGTGGKRSGGTFCFFEGHRRFRVCVLASFDGVEMPSVGCWAGLRDLKALRSVPYLALTQAGSSVWSLFLVSFLSRIAGTLCCRSFVVHAETLGLPWPGLGCAWPRFVVVGRCCCCRSFANDQTLGVVVDWSALILLQWVAIGYWTMIALGGCR